MRLLTAVSGVRVPQQAPEKHLMKGAFFLALFEDKNPARLIYARSEGTTYASMRIERTSRVECCSPSLPNKERVETNGDGVKPGPHLR